MKVTEIQDGILRLEAETELDNFAVASIHDMMCQCNWIDDDVKNNHGCKVENGQALNFCTVLAMDVAWMSAQSR